MKPVICLLLGSAMGALLTGCGGMPWDGPEGPPPPPPLFISPHGEAFRGGAGQGSGLDLWFAHSDQDQDGRISEAEFDRDAKAFFAVLDANHDGTVTSLEVTSQQKAVAQEVLAGVAPQRLRPTSGGMGGGGGPGGGPSGPSGGAERGMGARPSRGQSPMGASRFGLLQEPEPVMAADVDLSGRVTMDELTAKTAQRFLRLDVNGDHFIDRAELPAGPMGPERPPR
ncbi:MAG: hypothetical protein HXY22_13730 [Alphaproteobacteria bacterium]|nr:hypothetical protein [Alphaproteobacteria bacterium]